MRSLGDMQIKTYIIPGYKKPKIWTTSTPGTQAYKSDTKNKKIFYKNIYTCDTIYVYVLMYQGKMQNEKKHSFIGGEKKKT